MIVLSCLEGPRPGKGAKAAAVLARKLAPHATAVAVIAGGSADSESLAWAVAQRTFHRVIHLADGGLDKADFMTMGIVLAEVALQINASVVTAGEHSDVEGQGLVPAALAQQLQAPLIARVRDVCVASPEADAVRIVVTAGGKVCTLECPLPVVLSTAGASGGELTPDVSGAASAVELMTLGELRLDPSRLVPRPELLGSQIPLTPQRARQITVDEAARLLVRRR